MSLIIDPELRRQFKTATALQGADMSAVLLDFIKQYVQQNLPGKLQQPKKGGRK